MSQRLITSCPCELRLKVTQLHQKRNESNDSTNPPYSYLQQMILPKAHLYPDGRYTFNIRKRDYRFTWMHRVYMDGRQFFCPSFQLLGATILGGDIEEEIQKDLDASTLTDYNKELEETNTMDPTEAVTPEQTLEEKLRYRLHRTIERNQKLSAIVKQIHGYSCECCNFNFEKAYGELGKCYIEAHHRIPVAHLPPTEPHMLSPTTDFAVLCANCHRMAHRKAAPADFDDFVKLYGQAARMAQEIVG